MLLQEVDSGKFLREQIIFAKVIKLAKLLVFIKLKLVKLKLVKLKPSKAKLAPFIFKFVIKQLAFRIIM